MALWVEEQALWVGEHSIVGSRSGVVVGKSPHSVLVEIIQDYWQGQNILMVSEQTK